MLIWWGFWQSGKVELTFVELAKTALSLADDEDCVHLQGFITVLFC